MALVVDAARPVDAPVACATDAFVQPTGAIDFTRSYTIRGSVSDGTIKTRHKTGTVNTPVHAPQSAYPIVSFDDFFITDEASPPVVVAQSIFGDTAPTGLAAPDGNPYMLGTVFSVGVPGMITHVRVYRSPALVDSSCPIAIYANNNPVSVAYDENAAFTGAGWNDIPLPTPLAVTPSVHYMAAYFNPIGAYGFTSHMFDTEVVSGDLTGLSDLAASGNGKFRQTPIFALPDSSFNATWYGIDVKFVPDAT